MALTAQPRSSNKRFARSANFDRFTDMSFSFGSELQRTIHLFDNQQARTPQPSRRAPRCKSRVSKAAAL
jgi:hypothetical protein